MERLLDFFKPENYKLNLFIDKHKGKATGEAVITGEPLGPGAIKLHAKDLTIDRVRVDGEIVKFSHEGEILEIPMTAAAGDDRDPSSRSGFLTRDDGRVSAGPAAADDGLRLSPAVITIIYHFDLNTNMEGAYLSSYDYEGGEELLVSTQFESHYARECFPCIDEPAAKATFDLSITIPDEDDIVISNMPMKPTDEAKGLAERKGAVQPEKNRAPVPEEQACRFFPARNGSASPFAESAGFTWTFAQTPKMSTYLLAFCIGRFKKATKTSKNGVKVTTYCTLNHEKTALDFANDIATESLDFYDEKFGIKYPLEKLDQIAIPDFEAGAMENWGLVTYRESCLLADKTTSKSQREYISTVIAHELSHQWFGDLVTMKWWNNLWLNESFATLMEYICIDAIRSNYRIFEGFFTGECIAALNRDAYPGVQAVQQDVSDPAEIATLFDGAIVYAKGARLMFNLYRLMGEKAFFKGLRDYFKAHQYENTTGDDLWEALQKYVDFDVKNFMDAWISQPGFPVITDGEQQRFLLNGATDDTKWPIPEIKDDMSGHYILNLASDEFEMALEGFESLSMEQKVRLLEDRSLLSKTSLVSSATLLDLVPKFKNEKYPIWNPVSGLIADLRLFFTPDDPDFPAFQAYIRKIIEPQLTRLGVDPKKNEDDSEAKLREIMLGLAIFADDKPVIEKLAAKYSPNFADLDPETRYYILAAKMKVDEKNAFSELLEGYQRVSDPEIKSDLLFALSGAKNHTARLIRLLKEPKIVRPQDHLYLFARLIRNHKTKSEAVNWLYQNWGYLEELTGDKSIEDYPRILASVIRTPEEATAFENFFAEKADSPVLRRTLKVAKTEITARLRLLNLDNDEVHKRLKQLSL